MDGLKPKGPGESEPADPKDQAVSIANSLSDMFGRLWETHKGHPRFLVSVVSAFDDRSCIYFDVHDDVYLRNFTV